ncbi:MAG: branched-chain amino acid transporter [Clostridia bacterium]|jgi:branched-chain amino acid transport system permease protein|nr:branched-chain amino acid transporter [Clostridia bacterium]
MQQIKTVAPSVRKSLMNNWMLQIIIVVILAVIPFITGRPTQNMLILIFCMSVFAMSYDILLGYTGVISFGHAMFFGIGAYGISIYLANAKATMGNILLATLIALAVSMIISVFIGFLSLRVKNTYYAMITLAFAQVGVILAEKARHITNGYDGMTFRVSSVLMNKMLFYYIALGFLVLSFIFMWKFTTSPTGRVLVAIRENEQRAKFIGFNTLRYKIISTVVAGAMASLAGSMYAIHMRFVSTSVLGVAKTIDALLATVIGGMGNLYGAILGTGIVNFAGEYLSKLAKVHPIFERWYIIFGLLYILIVLFAPQGVIGLIKKITNKIAAKSVKR